MAPDIDFLADELRGSNAGPISVPSTSFQNLEANYNQAKIPQITAPCSVIDLFDEQATLNPTKTAVEHHDGTQASFQRLQHLSKCIASALPIGSRGTCMPICMDISIELVATILAILRVGGAYVILDPRMPSKRNNSIVKDIQAGLVLTQSKYASLFSKSQTIEPIMEKIQHGHLLPVAQMTPIDIDQPAYVLYTSGSTGTPKGVILSHRAVSHGIESFSLNGNARWLLFYNPVFSAAQRTILATICKGASLCLADRDLMATSLLQVIDDMTIDGLGITPSALSMLDIRNPPSSLKQISTVGEPLTQSVADAWASIGTLRVSYGLSECAQLNFGRTFNVGDNAREVGIPSDTVSATILDPETLKPVQNGALGELCLSGPQLAIGYHNRPTLTAEKFPVQNGERVFRTGDMARRNPNNNIEIVGRLDFMVKLHGQRIEPGEIASVIEDSAIVLSAVVVMAKVKNNDVLVAAIVPKNDGQEWQEVVSILRTDLQKTLPSYMIPSFSLKFSKLPQNTNGKVDIRQVKSIIENTPYEELATKTTIGSMVAVTDELKKKLRDMWADTLEIDAEKISLNDSFVALGGTSMQAIQVVQALRSVGVEVDFSEMLRTVDLAAIDIKYAARETTRQLRRFELVQSEHDRDSMDSDRSIVDAYPVTPLQEAVLASTMNGSNDYLYQRLYDIRHLDIDRLKLALFAVFLGNEPIRSTFTVGKTGLFQVVKSYSELPWSEKTMSVDAFLVKDKARGFEFGQPFVRFTVLSRQVLVVSMHHALFDFWSHRFLFDDAAQMYVRGKLIERPHWSLYANFINQMDVKRMQNFWRNYLEDAKPTLLNHAPVKQDSMVSKRFTISLKEIRRVSGLTMGSLIYAAWALVLAEHTGQDESTFATAISGREVSVVGIEKIDGPTLTIVPQRVQINRQSTFKEIATETRDGMVDMLKYSQYGMRRAVKAGGHQGVGQLLDTMVNILPKENRMANKDTSYIFQRHGPRPIWKTEFTTLEAEEEEGSIQLRLSSDMEHTRLVFILDQVLRSMHALVTQQNETISSVNLYSAEEEKFLLSHDPLDVQSLHFLHEGFEKTALEKPERVALSCENGSEHTYGQLDAASNRMARYLQSESVGPGQRIPLMLDKGPRMVLAMMAVLKCGAAYVPLSSENPLDRNISIIKEIGAPFVLTEDAQIEYLTGAQKDGLRFIQLDHVSLEGVPSTKPKVSISAEDPAYLIYTSGSTGSPKGVVVSHRAVAATISSLIKAENRDQGDWRTLQFSQYVFDVSVYDIFVTLSSAGTLCLAETEHLLTDLSGVINHLRVNHAFLTPSVCRLIKPEEVPSLKILVVGGEQVTKEIVSTWADKVRLINGYGPTEAAMLIITREIQPDSQANNIGKPLGTAHAVIVDPTSGSDRLVPYGAIGELCFSGPQLASGYFNRAEQTAAAWQQSEIVSATGGVMYRSGDLARFIPGREIECLGRKDGQVKINGLRIELGEIEQCTMMQDDVVDCVAMVVDWNGKSALVSFLALSEGVEKGVVILPASEHWNKRALEIKSALSLSLTPYMVPKAMFPLGAMPRSLSGKTDKKKLKALLAGLHPKELSVYLLNDSDGSIVQFLPLETKAQIVLHDSWKTVLRTGDLDFGRNAKFLDLGGDSIEAINLASNLRGKSINLSVAQILKSGSLEIMAALVNLEEIIVEEVFEKAIYDTPATVYDALAEVSLLTTAIESIYPCPPGQSEFLTQGARDHQYWNLMAVRTLSADADVDSWVQYTTLLTETNNILRTTFTREKGQWYGIVMKFAKPVIDTITVENEFDRQGAIDAFCQSRFEFGKPFINYLVLEHPDGKVEIAIKMDHGLYDGTLLRIFASHFKAFQEPSPIPVFTTFEEYASHEFQSNKKQALKFWTEEKRIPTKTFSFPILDSSHAEPRTDVAISATAISMSDVPNLEMASRSLGTTISIVYQAAFQLWLAHASGNMTEVQLDYLYTGRNVALPDPQSINGPCANFLPLRFQIQLENTVQEYLDSVAAEFWAATENGNVGLDDIYQAANGDHDTLRNTALYLFQPFTPLPPRKEGERELQDWIVMAKSQVTQAQPYSLVFEVVKTAGSAYRLKIGYDGRIFSVDEAKKVGEDVHQIVEKMIVDGGRRLGDLFSQEPQRDF